MEAIAAWFDKQARTEQSVVLLEDTLLGAPFWPYAIHRLRYFALRFVIDYGIHVLRFLLVFIYFGSSEFLLIFGAYALTGAITSFWWGALESMRERVRWLRRSERGYLIDREIGDWLTFSLQAGVIVVIVIGVYLVATITLRSGGIGPVDALLAAIMLRVAVNLGIRTYHSGVYSIRRIYRPPGAIVVAEVVGFGTTGALLPFLDQWAFVVGTLVAISMSALISFRYTRAAYRLSGIRPALGPIQKPGRLPRSIRTTAWFWSGVSYAVMRLDSLVLAIIFGIAARSRSLEDAELALIMFLIGPVVRAGFDWAQLFYFDFKRLEVDELKSFRRRFTRQVAITSLPISVVLWAVGSAVVSLVLWWDLNFLYLLLLQFFILRSGLAVIQMERFSNRHYHSVLRSGIVLMTGIFLVSYSVSGTHFVLAYYSVAIAGAGVLLLLERRLSRNGDSDRVPEALLEWLQRLRTVQDTVTVYLAEIAPPKSHVGTYSTGTAERHSRWQTSHMARRINRRLQWRGYATVFSEDCVAWFEVGHKRAAVGEMWLIKESGGLVRSLQSTESKAGGPAALETLVRQGSMRKVMTGGAKQDWQIDVEEIKNRFIRMFPGGTTIMPAQAGHGATIGLPVGVRRGIIRDAIEYLKSLKPERSRSAYETTALSLEGEVVLIFVVDRKSSRRRDRRRWSQMIGELNLRAALTGPA